MGNSSNWVVNPFDSDIAANKLRLTPSVSFSTFFKKFLFNISAFSGRSKKSPIVLKQATACSILFSDDP